MGDLVRLKKHKTIPFLNIGAYASKVWARIGRSTVFDLILNAVTEENNFIEDEMPTTDVTSYKPALNQELQTNKGDVAFDYVYDMFYNLPTGEAVKKELLIIFDGPTKKTGPDDEGVEEFKAWDCITTMTLDHFDSVAEKIYFNFSINKINRGVATVTNGEPKFTEA